MSTMAELVDRTYRDYLSNPSDTPVQVRLDSAMTAGTASLIYAAGELATEELTAIGPGTVVEVDVEMMRVLSHDESTRIVTVTRGLYGTTAAAHDGGSLVRVAPKWPRRVVFDALADEVVNLYPDVYAVGEEWGDGSDGVIRLSDTTNAVSILDARQLDGSLYQPVWAEIVDVQDVGLAIQVEANPGDVWVRYTKSFPRPTDESVDLADIGVQASWEQIIMFGALHHLLIQSDIDAATQEFVTEALENEGFRPTTGVDLSVALVRLRSAQLRQARLRLQGTQHNVSVVSRRVL